MDFYLLTANKRHISHANQTHWDSGRLANPYTVPRCNGIKVPRVPSCKPTAATANEMKKDTDFSLQAMMLCDAAM